VKALAIAGKGTAPAVIDVPEPGLEPGLVRVSVEAASVNGFDLAVASGRMWDTMPHEFPVVLGRDFVGTVAGVSDGVDLVPGERVAGTIVAPALGSGSIAECVTTAASAVARVPEAVSTRDAAAVGLAGVAAYDATAALELEPGDTLLVAGATGGVGSIAVQLAVGRGVNVIATARPGDEEDFVRSLGASHVVDYTEDLPAAVRGIAPDGVDKALHAAGDPASLATTLRVGGRLASMLGATTEQVGRDDIIVVAVVAHATPEKLADLLQEVASARLRVRVTTSVPLDRADEALAAFGGGTLGKVLVTR
jgi:NADPH:quinone reductase-like Zn-dependent oxidoreductase